MIVGGSVFLGVCYDSFMWKKIHRFLMPAHDNNHRSKALHHDSLLVYVLLFALVNFGIRTLHKQFPDVLGYATDIRVYDLLSETNRKRSELGLGAVVLNDQLSQAAKAKAQDMFANGYWAHTSPQGKTPWEFIVGSGYKYTLAGENLAKNFSTSRGVVDAWMASPTHRDNVIKPGYHDVGFAVVNGILAGEETTLVVQMFGASERIAQVPKQAESKQVEVPIEVPVLAELPELAKVNQQMSPASQVLPAVSGVSKSPFINIPTLTREISFLFIGILVGILGIDFVVVSRRKIPRVAGHNIAHIIFLSALVIALITIRRGSLI